MDKPPSNITVMATGQSKAASDAGRTASVYRIAACTGDAGVILTEPNAGYWMNINNASARALAQALLDWAVYQSERFRPSGFSLVNINTHERREIVPGACAVFIGDSFVIRDEAGTALTEALPHTDWQLQPTYPTYTE